MPSSRCSWPSDAGKYLLRSLRCGARLELNYADHANEASYGNRKSNLIFGKAKLRSAAHDPSAAAGGRMLDYTREFATRSAGRPRTECSQVTEQYC